MNEKQTMVKQMDDFFDGTYDDNSLLNYRAWFINHYQGVDDNYDQLKTNLLKQPITLSGATYQLVDTNQFAGMLIPNHYQMGETKLPTTTASFVDLLIERHDTSNLDLYGFEQL